VQAGAPHAKKDMAFQATMLGPMTPPPGAPPAAAPPAAGFGAPPAAGFGAPPAAGFGAPPAAGFGAPAAGGFGGGTPTPGTPTPGTPAPGGFGAPAAGGFGAPAGGQPAQGGGFAPAGGAPPAGSAPGGAPPSGGSKKKILIGVGVGCLFIIMVSCALGSWLCYRAKNAVQSGGQDIAAELNRFTLTLTLTGIKASCRVDPSGSGTSQSFHAQVFPQLQGTACQVTDDTIAAFGDNNRSEAHGAAGSDDEALATSLGADITQCYRYTSGTAKVTACLFPEGFKIISLENPGAVQ